MPLFLISILKSRYIWILIVFIGSIWMLNSYTNGEVEKAFQEVSIKATKLTKGDQYAVDKQDNDIGDTSILDWMFPEADTSDRQERDQGNSNQTPYAYPCIENGLKGDSGAGSTVELPFTSLFEYTEEDITSPKILQCTYEMIIDCRNYPKCCEYK